jgi:D-xylose transport system permease protein
MKVVAVAAAGVALVYVCNINRGSLFGVLRGVPYPVPIILGVLVLYTFALGRTRFGRYLYAIGGNAEAARRGGVSLGWNKFWAFVLTGVTSGAAGILYASRLGSVSNNIDGGTLVLYAVAAAVIGGTSLFGGRGKMVHALVGGLVIATIYNGMGLIGLAASYQFMVTALVLLAAVTVDALARRGRDNAA